MLGIGGHAQGRPFTRTECLIGGVLCLVGAICVLIIGFRKRRHDREGSADEHVLLSFPGALWFAFAALLCSLALLGEGFAYSPITRHTGWLLAGGFAVVFIALVREGLCHRKK